MTHRNNENRSQKPLTPTSADWWLERLTWEAVKKFRANHPDNGAKAFAHDMAHYAHRVQGRINRTPTMVDVLEYARTIHTR